MQAYSYNMFYFANVGQNIQVHYSGWLDKFDGDKKFDSSYDRGTPLSLLVSNVL